MHCRHLTAPIGVALFMLSGCERPPDEPASIAAAPATAPTAVPAAAPALPTVPPPVENSFAAESSLSIKRGIARAAGRDAVFRPCDDDVELLLVDEGDDMLAQLLAEGMKTAYVEVYGEAAPTPDNVPSAGGYPGVFLLEQLLYAGALEEDGSCAAAPAADAVVIAGGNEPSWTVQVTDTKAIWQQQDPAQELVLDTLQSEDAEGTVSYRASSAGHQLELLIDARGCRDLVSAEYFAFAAGAVLDGKEFKGCARVGR
jgi:uncharacterized membrane protein